ncbi:hypothetical protein FISHEDRAFT_57993 [Fistulina hepatica ATCC 64428]|uniref:SAP domain-containing protein n=1 Tax=Fistulina hepatica ATCC 64428 TaxID=1128425 RepID=A0A0D7AFY8_9AGAR|nr:hypothetical protein FISHEDRAFT_57993 [Fistulina hepatica ATCC 64428]
MSTSADILFNVPALQSLRREQLVQLCKSHSLKANGKNVDMINRLIQYASTLPLDAKPPQHENQSEATDVEMDDGAEAPDLTYTPLPRPSEVMERIEEVDERSGSSRGTLSSAHNLNTTASGEFGVTDTTCSKTNSVGHSLKAMASSLGLRQPAKSKKRPPLPTLNRDDLSLLSKPYSVIPPASPPQTDHFTFDPTLMAANLSVNPASPTFAPDTQPLPGHVLRPGVPAPANARMSLGLNPTPSTPTGPTTTLRLVSNPVDPAEGDHSTPRLKPFTTSFDLVMSSPCSETEPTGPRKSEAPTPPLAAPEDDDGVAMPGGFDSPTPVKTRVATFGMCAAQTDVSFMSATPEPFIFGSPLPKHRVSNAQFSEAAKSVLEEMNRRLAAEGVQSIDQTLLSGLKPGSHQAVQEDRVIKPLPRTSGQTITDKFNKIHEKQFSKMESIASRVRPVAEPERHAGKKRKSTAIEDSGAAPRRPSALRGQEKKTRVISNSRRNTPGAFGDDDERSSDDRIEDEKSGKRVRLSIAEDTNDPEAKARKEREREAIRRKLERSKARRRSSGLAGKSKAKPSRFGFFSAAKSMVSGLWNRSKAVPASTASSKLRKKVELKVLVTRPAPPAQPVKAPSLRVPSGSRGPVAKRSITKDAGQVASPRSTSSRVSRSPISQFPGAHSGSSTVSTTRSQGSSRTSPSSAGTRSPLVTRTSLHTRTTSTGAHASTSRRGSKDTNGAASSMGVRSSTHTASVSSIPTRTSRLSASSRLLAPTASSLAKTVTRASGSPLPADGAGNSKKPADATHHNSHALGSVTNTQLSNLPSVPITTPKSSATTKTVTVISKPAGSTITRQRTLNGRRPRISRGKVIAKLASKRAEGVRSGGVARVADGRPSAPGRRTRSSMGTKARESATGIDLRGRGSAGDSVAMSAKRRSKQSEYVRRKSRVGGTSLGAVGTGVSSGSIFGNTSMQVG